MAETFSCHFTGICIGPLASNAGDAMEMPGQQRTVATMSVGQGLAALIERA